MRGRIPYGMIVGYISPTFIKFPVDYAISQTRPFAIKRPVPQSPIKPEVLAENGGRIIARVQ